MFSVFIVCLLGNHFNNVQHCKIQFKVLPVTKECFFPLYWADDRHTCARTHTAVAPTIALLGNVKACYGFSHLFNLLSKHPQEHDMSTIP